MHLTDGQSDAAKAALNCWDIASALWTGSLLAERHVLCKETATDHARKIQSTGMNTMWALFPNGSKELYEFWCDLHVLSGKVD